jgi:hypothetical protein
LEIPYARFYKNDLFLKINQYKMEKYNYSTLKKLGKDELIYLISVIEKDIRKEYEKYTVPLIVL